MPSKPQSAFTLVELSIVLVILGLLVGGVLAGQSLIEAAERRKLMGAYDEYKTVAYTFREKYMMWPGDLNNASSFWPTAGNGGGDGHIDWWVESIYFWQHAANAGLIQGTYSVPAGYGVDAVTSVEIGVSHPRVFKQFTMDVAWTAITTARGSESKNWMSLSIDPNNVWITNCSNGVSGCLTAEEVWRMDSKMDDGRPMTGNAIVSWTHASCLAASDVAANNYEMTLQHPYCSAMIPLQ